MASSRFAHTAKSSRRSTDELEVIEASPELAELLARICGVTYEAQDELAARLKEADVAHASVIGGVVVRLAHSQESGVPAGAACRVSD
jgi:butyrate kinase